jgi:LacI family transcriptional regulator
VSSNDSRSGEATIYDVAQRAGVSISTVSLVINQPHRVRPDTRSRVVEAAGELGYRPSSFAERSRSRQNRVMVIAPFGAHPSYRARLVGVLDAAAAAGVEVVVHNAASAITLAAPLLDALPIRGDVGGVIVMGLPLSESGAARLRDWGPPIVLLDSIGDAFSSVTTDDEAGGYQVGRHLVDRGHRRIAFLHERQRSEVFLAAGHLRLDGLERAVAGFGEIVRIEVESGTVADGRTAAVRVLAAEPAITAVFANHDLLAAGVLGGLRAAGRRVPEDLAVVGFDDGDLAEALELTTVRQQFAESGRSAADVLLSRMASASVAVTQTRIGAELVVRSTT